MLIIINDKETEVQASTLLALAEELSLPTQGIAIAIRNRMIPRSEWASTPLEERCPIVIIKAACGG